MQVTDPCVAWGEAFCCSLVCTPQINFPVARRELRSYGYSYSLLNGELRSYQEFPNHILVNERCYMMIFHDSPSQSPENILFPTADFRRTFPLSTLAGASAPVRSHAAAAQPVASSSTSSGVSAVALTMLGASAMAGARRKNQVKVYHLDVGGSEWVPSGFRVGSTSFTVFWVLRHHWEVHEQTVPTFIYI